MFISYLTAPKAVTSHQGWCQLSTKWWWPPLRRLPNIQPYHWVPTSPLTNDVHVENLDINFDQSGKSDFFFKKPVEISLALSTPRGGLFCFFFKRKRWHSTMFVRRGRNTKAYALCFGVAKITRRRKFVQVCCVCIFAFFPVFFTGLVVLFDAKVVLFFLPIVVCCHFGCVCSPALELLMLQSCCCACACW